MSVQRCRVQILCPEISVPRARQLLNQHPSLSSIAHGEDPYPGPFVEEVSFHGGSYPVFPGLTAGVTYVFVASVNASLDTDTHIHQYLGKLMPSCRHAGAQSGDRVSG